MKAKCSNNNDPRVTKTKAQFMRAFKELVLLYDDYVNISVKELCDKAGLTRKTFYLHYEQIDDFFTLLQDEIIEKFNSAIVGLDIYNDVEKVVKVFFELNESDPVYQKICLSPHYFYTKEHSRRKSVEVYKQKNEGSEVVHKDPSIQDYVITFYFYNGYLLYAKWVRSNRAIPIEEAIKITACLIKNGVSSAKDLQSL